jgi:hypothetical protein
MTSYQKTGNNKYPFAHSLANYIESDENSDDENELADVEASKKNFANTC